MTIPKPQKQKKPTRKSLIDKLDKVFSIYIRMRDGWRCVTCGETDRAKLSAGHLFSRAHYSTRWDFENVFCQCVGCNLRHEHDPFALTTYYLNRFGRESYEELHEKYSTPRKYKDDDLIFIIDYIQAKIENLKERNQ